MSEVIAKFDVFRLGSDAKLVQDLTNVNAALGRLASRRKLEIRVEGPLARSKIAWNVVTYEQAILYRIVMLAKGAAEAWNSDNFLTCILTARSLTETFAVLFDYERQLSLMISKGNLSDIHALTQRKTFATRDAIYLKQRPQNEAVNMITLVRKMDKSYLPGVLNHYESLSERCHPNTQGHHQMFASTDRSSGTVTFSESKRGRDSQLSIMGSIILIHLSESIFDRLDKAVLEIAALQHLVNPAPPKRASMGN